MSQARRPIKPGDRVALYMRESLDDDGDTNDNLTWQRQACTQRADNHDLKIVAEHIDTAANDDARPGYQALARQIKKHEIDVVMIARPDRLADTSHELYRILLFAEEHKVALDSVRGPLPPRPGTPAERDLLDQIMFMPDEIPAPFG